MDAGEYISGKILSRDCKAIGNTNMVIISNMILMAIQVGFDLYKFSEWNVVTEEVPVLFNSNEILAAKEKEFKKRINDHVFDKVEDQGKNAISIRWVVTEKVKDGLVMTKTRLCSNRLMWRIQLISARLSNLFQRSNLHITFINF